MSAQIFWSSRGNNEVAAGAAYYIEETLMVILWEKKCIALKESREMTKESRTKYMVGAIKE